MTQHWETFTKLKKYQIFLSRLDMKAGKKRHDLKIFNFDLNLSHETRFGYREIDTDAFTPLNLMSQQGKRNRMAQRVAWYLSGKVRNALGRRTHIITSKGIQGQQAQRFNDKNLLLRRYCRGGPINSQERKLAQKK